MFGGIQLTRLSRFQPTFYYTHAMFVYYLSIPSHTSLNAMLNPNSQIPENIMPTNYDYVELLAANLLYDRIFSPKI